MEFHNKLKELRANAGMTQQQLGAQIGVTKSVISYYELQERMPSPEILIKLAAVFHVSADYLLGIEKSSVIDVSGLKDEDITMLKQMVVYMRTKNENSSS
ncbi:MAG: helix-turn-helix domain-containing protein [Ruminococcus flavefaciens]|nr:helix-turn-helix domain-containing protein [Ruminococcus flavefaciens]